MAFKMLEKRFPGGYTWKIIESWLREDRIREGRNCSKSTYTNSENSSNKIKGDKCEHTL